jgi:hypothetical protein
MTKMDREIHLSAEQRELISDRATIQLPTPLLNSVEVPRFSISAALLMLHHQRCRSAVVGALDGLRDYQVNQRCLAELLIYYDMLPRLVALLELCIDDLLFYVIQMPIDGVPELADRIVRARDLALSVRAKRAAQEILEDLK